MHGVQCASFAHALCSQQEALDPSSQPGFTRGSHVGSHDGARIQFDKSRSRRSFWHLDRLCSGRQNAGRHHQCGNIVSDGLAEHQFQISRSEWLHHINQKCAQLQERLQKSSKTQLFMLSERIGACTRDHELMKPSPYPATHLNRW